MNRVPSWTLDEFRIVLESKGTPPFNLALQLPGRTAGAVAVVQQGVHAFHLGNNHSMLSRTMVDYLEEQRGTLVCPVCGRKF
jgi:hypothetical protein